MKNVIKNKAILNSISGIISYLVIMGLTMITRIMFATYLGKELLGLNSLFISVLQILQISELGINTAMVVCLYEPLKNNDINHLQALMSLYRKVYIVFSVVLLAIGLLVMQFIIPTIVIVNNVSLTQVKIYFLLFLVGIVFSYIGAYNKSILFAEENNRIVSYVNLFQKTVICCIQIVLIYYFQAYLLYLISMIVGYILNNFLCAVYVRREHPEIYKKSDIKILQEEKKKIIKLVKSIFVIRLSDKIMQQTDSILINMYVSLIVLGIYSNYQLIITACIGLFNPVGSALTSSYGNSSLGASCEEKYSNYEKTYFYVHIVALFICMMFIALIQDFINVFFGFDYLLSASMVGLLAIYLYLSLVKTIYYSYQNALGLHRLDRNIIIVQAIINIVFSLVLGNILGINGIILGSILSLLLCSIAFKGRLLYERVFHKKASQYYLKTIFNLVRAFITLSFSFYVSEKINVHSIDELVLEVMLIVLLNILLLVIAYIRNENLYGVFVKAKRILFGN